MFEKLEPVRHKYEDIEWRISQPETISNSSLYTSLMKEYNERNGNYYLDKIFNDFLKKWKKAK